jgi:hypothetical protein
VARAKAQPAVDEPAGLVRVDREHRTTRVIAQAGDDVLQALLAFPKPQRVCERGEEAARGRPGPSELSAAAISPDYPIPPGPWMKATINGNSGA